MHISRTFFLVAAVGLGALATGHAKTRSTWFDPARHMPLEKVKPGMKGYGLSVFRGTKLEKFNVEIIDIMYNDFSPNLLYGAKFNIILAKLTGKDLERSGVIAGMSGSPVYLRDPEDGKDKIIGAVAFGWGYHTPGPPITGLQPIEQVLRVGAEPRSKMQPQARARPGELTRKILAGLPTPSQCPDTIVLDRYVQAGLIQPPDANPDYRQGSPSPSPLSSGLVPLAVPVSVAGLDPTAFASFRNVLRPYGLMMVNAGSAVSGIMPDSEIVTAGSLSIPYILGDINVSAVGTVVDRIGDRVWAFGHQMDSRGTVELPIASGVVHTIIANQINSFKLASSGRPIGTLTLDENAAVFGRVGKAPIMVPMSVVVGSPNGTEHYTYKIMKHRDFSPILALISMLHSVLSDRGLPELHTIAYRGSIRFGEFGELLISNVTTDRGLFMPLIDVADPMDIMLNNPFRRVWPTEVKVNITITAESRSARIIQAVFDRPKYRPGDKATVALKLKRFRGPTFDHKIAVDIPHDLPDGTYKVTVGGAFSAIRADRRSHPHLYQPQKLDDLFALIKHVAAFRDDRIYLTLEDRRPGLGIYSHTLSDMPAAKITQMQAADPRLAMPIRSAQTTTFPTEVMVAGMTKLKLIVARSKK